MLPFCTLMNVFMGIIVHIFHHNLLPCVGRLAKMKMMLCISMFIPRLILTKLTGTSWKHLFTTVITSKWKQQEDKIKYLLTSLYNLCFEASDISVNKLNIFRIRYFAPFYPYEKSLTNNYFQGRVSQKRSPSRKASIRKGPHREGLHQKRLYLKKTSCWQNVILNLSPILDPFNLKHYFRIC